MNKHVKANCHASGDRPPADTRSATLDTIYTCPMHPQVRGNAPGY
jgi:hypothetical protein